MSTQDNNPYALTDEAWQAFSDRSQDFDLRPAVEAAARVMIRDLQAHIENAGVRGSRANGWCAEFSRIMWRAFPAGPLDGSDWRDSDGVDCRGHEWVDAEGYSRAGFRNGRDRDGFDTDGRDVNGLDRDGKDRDGFTIDDPARYRYRYITYNGLFDVTGFGPDGDVYRELTRDTLPEWAAAAAGPDSPFTFSRDGYDRDGYGTNGRDRDGFSRDGTNRDGLTRDGFTVNGFRYDSSRDSWVHRNGTDRDDHGFDRYGYHVMTGRSRDPDGYDAAGNDREGNPRPVTADATTAV